MNREKDNFQFQKFGMTPEQIKSLREHLCMTQPELAAELGITPRTLRNWESGIGKGPRRGDVMLMKSLL